MNLIRFCENHYQELNYTQQSKEDYDVKVDAEIKAVHTLLSSYRTWLKWILVPKCIMHFLLVKIKVLREPVPILLNKIKEQKLAEEVAKKLLEDGKKNTETTKVVPIKATPFETKDPA